MQSQGQQSSQGQTCKGERLRNANLCGAQVGDLHPVEIGLLQAVRKDFRSVCDDDYVSNNPHARAACHLSPPAQPSHPLSPPTFTRPRLPPQKRDLRPHVRRLT